MKKETGFYARDKVGNLLQFKWTPEDQFMVLQSDGEYVERKFNDYEIIFIKILTAEDF